MSKAILRQRRAETRHQGANANRRNGLHETHNERMPDIGIVLLGLRSGCEAYAVGLGPLQVPMDSAPVS